MELTFEFTDKARWKIGKFVFEDIQIVGESDDVTVDYDDIELYLDGKLYEGGIATFRSNSLSVDELFENVLNSYLRNNTGEYKSFGKEWNIFDKIMKKAKTENGLVIKLPVYDGFNICMYELQLATPEHRFYAYFDMCMMLDVDGEIITDYENFYMEAFDEDLVACLKGEVECLYRGYDVVAMLEEYGGEQGFLDAIEE